jgi:hypothetical protein
MRYLWLVGVAAASYLAGACAYLLTLWILWRQSVGGDLKAILFWGGLAYVLVALPLYLVFFMVVQLLRRHVFHAIRRAPGWMFPLAGGLLGVAPTYAILRSFSGGWRQLFTAEAALFLSFFGVSGLCFGIGWWWVLVRPRPHG